MEEQKVLSKEEIVSNFENAIQEKPIEDLISSFKEISIQYNEARESAYQKARELYLQNEENEAKDFKFAPEASDVKFKELLDIYKEKKQTHKKEIASQQEENFNKKTEIVAQLKELTDNELSNIGASFQKFYDLRDAWNAVGDVNQARYKQLQFDYSHLSDLFYYNIGVHKQLANYDLKKNGELKEKLITKIHNLKDIESIRQLEHFIKEYQNEWDALGPTTQEKWDELKDNYWSTVNGIYDKIKGHYQSLRDKEKERLTAKNALVEKVQETLSSVQEEMKIKDWNNITTKVQELQQEWKSVGFGKKASEQELWDKFKGSIDSFFKQKSEFFGSLKEAQGVHADKRRKLIERAKSMQNNTDWQDTTKKFVRLQRDWKESGSVEPKLDRKLWTDFRSACDTFFNAKKEYYDTLDDRLADNLKKKDDIVSAIAEAKDIEALKSHIGDWHSIGFVPKKAISSAKQKFDSTITDVSKKLKIEDVEGLLFESKISAYKKSENAEDLIREERAFVRAKLDKLKDEWAQYENNLSFFGQSKGAQKLKEVVAQKLNGVKVQMESMEQRLNMLRQIKLD